MCNHQGTTTITGATVIAYNSAVGFGGGGGGVSNSGGNMTITGATVIANNSASSVRALDPSAPPLACAACAWSDEARRGVCGRTAAGWSTGKAT